MHDEFEVRTVSQLRVINAPARRAIFEALLEGPQSAASIGARCGQSPEAVHYHIKRLQEIKLVRIAEERETGARPEKIFELTHRRLELKRDRRGPAFMRELVRGVRLMLRLAEREYEQASDVVEPHRRPRIARFIAWLSTDDLKQVERLEAELDAILRNANERANRVGPAGRERVAITILLAPVEDPKNPSS